jgi:hypothetical protein
MSLIIILTYAIQLRRMIKIKIYYCPIVIPKCKYRLANKGSRCCCYCELKDDCKRVCLNDVNNCGILKEDYTQFLGMNYRKDWSKYEKH